MKRSLVAISLVALVGCSTPLERRQASGGFEYEQAKAGQQLVIPDNLKQPNYSREYQIPQLGSKVDSSIQGARLDVRPPLQVLPLAAGTRLQDGTDSVTVIIEATNNNDNLTADIDNAIIGYLGSRNITIASNQGGVITTDWIETNEVIGKSWFKDKVYQVRQRYQFARNVKDHGRSGSVSIEVIDHQESLDGVDEQIVLTNADKRRYAIDMLNGSISYLNFERNKQQALQELANSRSFSAELGFDADGNSAFVANAPFEQVWTRMQKLLPAMGFQIKDLDRQLGTLFVDYQSDSGFWQNLWGSDDVLPLEPGNYQVKVAEQGESTAITFMDADAQPLPADKVTAMANTLKELVKKELKDL
ncbi:outer membrane protein assembly factor BamC [Ferrimonas senticii]|uniref:outer membrane protein assembly factor BamC n=1 Tax=Ferrimonas senticii TaxID=394566 RepID=UPI00055277AA|nr:outer membrane protein assembly factor BamC [Ferrimonas senticii]